MTIRVLLFASIAQAVGQRELSLDLPAHATAADALARLADLHESIAAQRDSLAIAVNEELAHTSRTLKNGDTLALLPPVSGG